MMNTFPASLIPTNEAARLRTLHLYQIVNTTPEPIFDAYVAWAAQLFNTPISLISLVDEKQVWFKSAVGSGGIMQLERTESMCSAAILPDVPVVLSDYRPESCELIKPDVAQAIGLNFYAGAALRMPDGARIGMMAVIGKEERPFSDAEATVLSKLAGLVSQTIELRFHYLVEAEKEEEWEDAQRELAAALDDNTTLARYLLSRATHIDLNDDAVAQLIMRRLESVAKALDRRLNQLNRMA